MMRPNAGLHADQTRPHIGKPCLHLAARPLLAKHHGPAIIETNEVELVLTNINADYCRRSRCCRRHSVLLVWAPLASLSLAGQEHGRTIPLAVLAGYSFQQMQALTRRTKIVHDIDAAAATG